MRFIKICRVLSKYLIFYKFTRHCREIFGVRLRLAFEELGITFIKIGQIISMRYDLLGEADRKALRSLLDDVNPIPFSEIKKILSQEYSCPLEAIFSEIQEKPVGSASVSQVHKAWLLNGAVAAVKIKRPGVDKTFIRDINFLKILASIGERFSSKLRYIRAKELVAYFESWIRQDLDFVLEIQNMKKIAEQYEFATGNFRSDLGRGTFPKAFDQLCTSRVIVMDFIDGIPMNRKEQILQKENYDLAKSVRTYIVAAIRSWFEARGEDFYFQADPHFSNILALPNGNVAAIDHGLVCRLPKNQAELLKDLVLAVYLKDLGKVVQIALEMTDPDPKYQDFGLESDLKIFLDRAQHETFGFWFSDFVKVLVRHHKKIPVFIVSFGRAAVMIDGLAHEYLPGESTLDILDYEFKRAILIGTARQLISADWKKLTRVLLSKINNVEGVIKTAIENPAGFVAGLGRIIKSVMA